MVGLRVINSHHFTPRGGIYLVEIAARYLPFGQHILVIKRAGNGHRKISGPRDRLARVSVDFVESGSRRVVEIGMKRESEKAALIVSRAQGNEAR